VQIIIALVLGAVIAAASAAVLVHDASAIHPGPTRTLYSYGST